MKVRVARDPFGPCRSFFALFALIGSRAAPAGTTLRSGSPPKAPKIPVVIASGKEAFAGFKATAVVLETGSAAVAGASSQPASSVSATGTGEANRPATLTTSKPSASDAPAARVETVTRTPAAFTPEPVLDPFDAGSRSLDVLRQGQSHRAGVGK